MTRGEAGTLAALLLGHALADGPLQPPWLSRAKRGNRPGLTGAQALALHGGLHGLAVALATRRPALGFAEAAAHAGIDRLKCRGLTTTREDQLAHLACKLMWAALAGARLPPQRSAMTSPSSKKR